MCSGPLTLHLCPPGISAGCQYGLHNRLPGRLTEDTWSNNLPWYLWWWPVEWMVSRWIQRNSQEDIDGLVHERHNSIANALELRLSCINPSIWNASDYLQTMVRRVTIPPVRYRPILRCKILQADAKIWKVDTDVCEYVKCVTTKMWPHSIRIKKNVK